MMLLLLTGLAWGDAICRDGTYSYSSGSGTCSWHGGVAQWVVPESYEQRIQREAEERKARQQIARVNYLHELSLAETAKCSAPRDKLYEYMWKEDWDAFDKQAKVVDSFDEVACRQRILDTIDFETCEIFKEWYPWPLGFTTHTILEELRVPTKEIRHSWSQWYHTNTFYPNSHRGLEPLHEGFYLRDNFWIVVNTSGTINVEYHELEGNPFGLGDNFIGTIEGVSGTMYWLVMDMQGNGHKLRVKETKLVTETPCHQIRSKR